LLIELLQLGGLLRRRDGRLVLPADGTFLDVGEESAELVELFGGERIELVIVAFGAAERQAEPDRGDVADAIGEILGLVLLRLSAAFLRCLQEAIVSRGDTLLGRGAG